jgi:hypothetical protein
MTHDEAIAIIVCATDATILIIFFMYFTFEFLKDKPKK